MKPRWFKTRAKAMAWLVRHGRGRAFHVVTLHDNWCQAPGAPCNCKPDTVIEDMTADNLIRGAAGTRAWRERHKWN